MGMKAPQSRIGSACSLILLRKVKVSCSGRRKSSWRMRWASSSWSKVVGKSVGASRHGPRSIATTSRPSSVNSFARIEPVQPSPMIATSFLGSLRAIVIRPSGFARVPIHSAFKADGRTGITLVVTIDPVAVIVAGAGKADHAPRAHVAIATVDRISEKSLLRVFDQKLEERLAVDANQLRIAVLEAAEDGVFVGVVDGSKRTALCGLAILVERRERLTILLRRPIRVLRTLLLGSLDEWRPKIEPGAAAVGPGELPIDEDCAARILAAGCIGVWRDQELHEGFDCGALARVEEDPWPLDQGGGRRAGFRAPGQPLRSSARCGSDKQERSAPEQFASMKPQGRSPAKARYLRSVNLARQ